MANDKLNKELVSRMMDDAAWKELLLEKYMNYVDWKEILYLCRRDLQGGHF